jgi:hypothetical protein
MSGGFTKLHSTILDSSVWGEDDATRIVWITLLAMADANGEVQASIGGIARRANVTRDKCSTAIDKFMSPDPDDRSGVADGRRLTVIRGGYYVINHQLYRDGRDLEKRREQNRRASAKYRATHNKLASQPRQPLRQRNKPVSAQAEAEAEAEAEEDPPPTPQGDGATVTARPKRTRAKARSAIPEHWQVPEAESVWAGEQGLSPQQIARERDGFVDFWLSDGGLKADWGRTFRNRVRSGIANGRIKVGGATTTAPDDVATADDYSDTALYGRKVEP